MHKVAPPVPPKEFEGIGITNEDVERLSRRKQANIILLIIQILIILIITLIVIL